MGSTIMLGAGVITVFAKLSFSTLCDCIASAWCTTQSECIRIRFVSLTDIPAIPLCSVPTTRACVTSRVSWLSTAYDEKEIENCRSSLSYIQLHHFVPVIVVVLIIFNTDFHFLLFVEYLGP
jgi:hypothetical protein